MNDHGNAADINYPQANFETFMKFYEGAVGDFLKENRPIVSLQEKSLSLADYHGILLSIFHQVYMGASSLALAGAMIDSRQFTLREYLFHHAEEEMLHWNWILDDLKSTKYIGADPRVLFPKPQTQAYLSYAMFLAHKFPLGRLGMAMVLEGVSGRFGATYGGSLLTTLGLKKDNVSFFLSHGELDKGHTEEIIEVLKGSKIDGYEWAQLCHVAKCTSYLYKQIYNSYRDEMVDINKT